MVKEREAQGGQNEPGSVDLDRVVEELFELTLMFWALRHRKRSEDPYDLTEPEFITLDTLMRQGTCTVGELQRVLEVQPAQMSRIIRSLENKGESKLVRCELNADDRRRIDVSITDEGSRIHDEYRERRMKTQRELMAGLSKPELQELARMVARFREMMASQISGHRAH